MELYIEPFIYFLLRTILGALFFFQAWDKVVRIKLPEVCKEVCIGTTEKGIPKWFAEFSVYVSSYIELLGGFMLLVGLFTTPVLFLLGMHLLLVTIAFSFLKGVWDTQHVFIRLVLLIVLLLLPQDWNVWSVDGSIGW